MKQYKWNFDKITALLVATGNCTIALYVMIRFLTDPYFLLTQTGLSLSQTYMVVPMALFVSITIFLNLKLIQKQHHARLIIAFAQTIGLACVIRNLFVGYLYFGFGFGEYLRNTFAFILYATLIYNTLFSKQIRSYFETYEIRNRRL